MKMIGLIGLLTLGGCASFMQDFRDGYNSVNGPGGLGDQMAVYTTHMVQGYAAVERENEIMDRQVTNVPQLVQPVYMVAPQGRKCIPQTDYNGRVIGCL